MGYVLLLISILLNLDTRLRLREIEIQGNTPFNLNSLLQEISPPDTGYPMDSVLITAKLKDIQRFFWDRGYPFAKTNIVRFDGPSDSLVMIVHINPGRFVLLKGVRVYGLKNTNPGIVYVHLKRLSGGVFNYTKVRDALAKVVKIYPILSMKTFRISHGDTLIVEFNEKPSNLLEVAGGYSKGTGFTGNLTFLSKNVFGTGRRMKIHWTRISLQNQTFGIVFQDPTTLVRYVYEVFAGYTFRANSFWQREFGGKIGPIFSPIKLLIGFRQVSSMDLQTKTSSNDYLSTVLLDYNRFEGWQVRGDIQIGRNLIIWKLNTGYGLSHFFNWRTPFVLNPYLKVYGVSRRGGLNRFDYIEMGGIQGPLGYPPASIYFRDYTAVGTTLYLGKTWDSPFLMVEWSQGKATTGAISTKGIAIGFNQTTGFGKLLVVYSLKLGNPIDEGLLSMSMITSF